jgi:hypothetical protein
MHNKLAIVSICYEIPLEIPKFSVRKREEPGLTLR